MASSATNSILRQPSSPECDVVLLSDSGSSPSSLSKVSIVYIFCLCCCACLSVVLWCLLLQCVVLLTYSVYVQLFCCNGLCVFLVISLGF